MENHCLLSNKVAITTLGCKVNQAESRDIKNQFIELGYISVDFSAKADIYVINTCSVTHIAERKSRNYIRRAVKLNPEAKIIVCGCYADLTAEKLKKEIPEIYKIVLKDQKMDIKKWGLSILSSNHELPLASAPVCLGEGRVRQFLKVQDGCDQYCSYCVIPYARGQVISYDLKVLVSQAKKLIENDAVELILTGINLGKYNDQGKDLVDLIEELEKIDGLKRIRLSSIEPNLITDRIIEKINSSEIFSHHLHIPLQSGSNRVLKMMERPYSFREYAEIISKIRKKIKDIAITTDVIVGFPGETKEYFQEALTNIRNLKFADLHIFKYSPRPQTKAFNYAQVLSQDAIGKMLLSLMKVKKQLRIDYLKNFINKEQKVLIQEIKNNKFKGLTSEYILVTGSYTNEYLGQIKKLRPKKIFQQSLLV